MSEDIKRQHRACFTGHRPHKLHQPESVVIAALEEKIREAIDDGFITFISGMARYLGCRNCPALESGGTPDSPYCCGSLRRL